MNEKAYFSELALAHLVSAQGLTVDSVICHLWQNRLDPAAKVELIDNLELRFAGGERVNIGSNAEGTGLDVIPYDFAAAQDELKKEFDDKIRVFAVNASSTKMWVDVIGKTLKKVRVTKEDGRYLSDSIVLDFGDEMREVSVAPLDGIIFDYYEEDATS